MEEVLEKDIKIINRVKEEGVMREQEETQKTDIEKEEDVEKEVEVEAAKEEEEEEVEKEEEMEAAEVAVPHLSDLFSNTTYKRLSGEEEKKNSFYLFFSFIHYV